jgi:alkylated DNA nucleotide flippase Atl1
VSIVVDSAWHAVARDATNGVVRRVGTMLVSIGGYRRVGSVSGLPNACRIIGTLLRRYVSMSAQ